MTATSSSTTGTAASLPTSPGRRQRCCTTRTRSTGATRWSTWWTSTTTTRRPPLRVLRGAGRRERRWRGRLRRAAARQRPGRRVDDRRRLHDAGDACEHHCGPTDPVRGEPMMPSVRNGIRPAQEKGPTGAGSGAILAMHTAAQYEEKGGSVTVSIGEGAQRPGLTLSLAPAGAPRRAPTGSGRTKSTPAPRAGAGVGRRRRGRAGQLRAAAAEVAAGRAPRDLQGLDTGDRGCKSERASEPSIPGRGRPCRSSFRRAVHRGVGTGRAPGLAVRDPPFRRRGKGQAAVGQENANARD